MRNDQKKFLKERLFEARRLYRSRIPSRWDRTAKEPAEVVAARAAMKKAGAVINRWDKQLGAKYDAITAKLEAEFRVAQEALLFHDAQKALKAIEAFEKRVPKAP